MYTPHTYPVALLMMLVSMLCWGSWANTQKIDKTWRFELFYWDYMWGIVLCALLFGLTLGRTNPAASVSFFHNLGSATARSLVEAFAGGVIFDLGNLLLVAAISVAGMAVAFPLGAGLGPVGLLAAMVLVLRGGEVYGLDVVDSNTARPKWLSGIGGCYIDGRQVPADQVETKIGGMDFILDATGIAKLEFNLLDALALNGMYVLTGIPGGNRPLQIPGAELIRQLVLDNQVLLGSVNAARGHFQMAADDLAQAHLHWGAQVAGLITNRYTRDQFAGLKDQRQPDAIKEVIEWAQPGR
jgi:Zn-dependent alcohol dehydrogenase